jgi:hypothetical protein
VGTELFSSDGQTDRRTEVTKLKFAYRNCPANEPKREYIFGICTYTVFEKQEMHRREEYCFGNIRDLEVEEGLY